MEETLTLHRQVVSPFLRRNLRSKNVIESWLATVWHVTRNVTHRQGGDRIARWTAAALLKAKKKFRRVKGYRALVELARKSNPELHSQQPVVQDPGQ